MVKAPLRRRQKRRLKKTDSKRLARCFKSVFAVSMALRASRCFNTRTRYSMPLPRFSFSSTACVSAP